MKPINEYFSYNEKISSIDEYLITKKHHKTTIFPEYGCTVKEVIQWLENNGVTHGVKFDGNLNIPDIGELMYEVGPGRENDIRNPQRCWVSLIGNPIGHNYQLVCCKPKHKSSYCTTINDFFYRIDFDKAIEMMQWMINNPNKKFDI